jgi:hypothetical protein
VKEAELFEKQKIVLEIKKKKVDLDPRLKNLQLLIFHNAQFALKMNDKKLPHPPLHIIPVIF